MKLILIMSITLKCRNVRTAAAAAVVVEAVVQVVVEVVAEVVVEVE